jgi:hypothetical protein
MFRAIEFARYCYKNWKKSNAMIVNLGNTIYLNSWTRSIAGFRF